MARKKKLGANTLSTLQTGISRGKTLAELAKTLGEEWCREDLLVRLPRTQAPKDKLRDWSEVSTCQAV